MIDKCCVTHENEDINKIKLSMPVEGTLTDLAEFFKMLGDSTRIKIICVLFHGEMCVSGIVELLEMSQSSISHQLRILKSNRIVKSRKDGKHIYYTLDDNHIKMIYEMGLEHIIERG